MATLRAAQKELTRRLLLDSALELFGEKGYPNTTIDDIASAAGTTRVTFYAYFPSRSDLMKALIDERLNEALQRSRSGAHGSTAQDLVAAVADGSPEAIGGWLRQAADRWPEIRPIIRIGREAAAVDSELSHLVERWLEEAVGDVVDGLDQAGRLDPRFRHFTGVLAMAELDYVAQNAADPSWGLTHEQMLEALTSSWVRLLT
jgi:AcrR family transcriptional regulator